MCIYCLMQCKIYQFSFIIHQLKNANLWCCFSYLFPSTTNQFRWSLASLIMIFACIIQWSVYVIISHLFNKWRDRNETQEKVFATCLPTLLHTENLKRQGEGNFHLVCLHDIGFTNLSKYFGSLNQYDGPMHA